MLGRQSSSHLHLSIVDWAQSALLGKQSQKLLRPDFLIWQESNLLKRKVFSSQHLSGGWLDLPYHSLIVENEILLLRETSILKPMLTLRAFSLL